MKNKNENKFLIFLLIVVWLGVISYIVYSEINRPPQQVAFEQSISSNASSKGLEYENLINKNNEQYLTSQERPGYASAFEFSPAAEVVFPTAPVKKTCGDYHCFEGDEFIEHYNNFERSQLSSPKSADSVIYGDKSVDLYIKNVAISRGYIPRYFAKESSLVSFNSLRTLPQVRDHYKLMRNEMLELGIKLHFVSGYRSAASQRSIFKRKFGVSDIQNIPLGKYDAELDTVLAVSAIPGYSKHHSGYAVDFGCGNDYLVYRFAETECYEWMSANNFENAKRFGFIPSYPNGVQYQGPNPEPWEFVWVGEETLLAQ